MALELSEESRKASRTERKSPLQDQGISPKSGAVPDEAHGREAGVKWGGTTEA